MHKFRDSTAGSVVILALICAVVTAALAGAYNLTKDTIEAAKQAAIAQSLLRVLPDAEGFAELPTTSLPPTVTTAYKAENQAGYVFLVEEKGYGGSVTFIVGLNTQGNVQGIEMTDHAETPGIGTKVAQADYLSRYYGSNDPHAADTIAGATRTSSALQRALEAAQQAYTQVA